MIEKKDCQQFLLTFEKENYRKLNLILFSLFFLIFPPQNAYQTRQPLGEKPLVRQINFALPPTVTLPFKQSQEPPPYLTAKAALVIDLKSKTILYQKNPDLKLYPASTTKIMTALVAADFYQPNDILTVKTEWRLGQTVGLKMEERLTFESLLYGLLVGSGNDVAYVLAENYVGGIKNFIEAMNIKAKNLNLNDTHFSNVVGIDTAEHQTTVHDLALLTAEALKNPLIAKVVATSKIRITDLDGKNSHFLENTNKLLGQVTGLKGVKTGWTENAGECLVAYVQREKGQIISVILGSNDRFGETRNLIEWVYENFQWQTLDTIHQ